MPDEAVWGRDPPGDGVRCRLPLDAEPERHESRRSNVEKRVGVRAAMVPTGVLAGSPGGSLARGRRPFIGPRRPLCRVLLRAPR